MKNVKIGAAFAGVMAFAMAGTGQAATIDGIVVDPGQTEVKLNFLQQDVVEVGDELSGFGYVSELDGRSQAAFAPGGNELTFEYGGYTLSNGDPNNLVFELGWMNFYVGEANYDRTDPSTASDGTLWLSLDGHENMDASTSDIGTLFGEINGSLGDWSSGSGEGLLSVNGEGGSANPYFDTDTIADNLSGFADLTFSSSFQPTDSNVPDEGGPWSSGTAEAQGTVIPEPGAFALMGLGLLAAGARRPRRRA